MTNATFALSAFGDEIDNDLKTQLQTLRELHVGGLELRGAWGVNVLKLSDAQAADVHKLCEEYGVKVRCLGSPVGKTPILDRAGSHSFGHLALDILLGQRGWHRYGDRLARERLGHTRSGRTAYGHLGILGW